MRSAASTARQTSFAAQPSPSELEDEELQEQEDTEQAQQSDQLGVKAPLQSWVVVSIAREVSMSVKDVLAVKGVFDSFDVDKTGYLDIREFDAVVQKLRELQMQAPKMHEGHWMSVGKVASNADADNDKSGRISFEEFCRWYSSNGFKESLLLSEEEQNIRSIAKRFNVSLSCVDRIKQHFDAADKDHSGTICRQEFAPVLCRILKITQDTLPSSRIQHFWTEVDRNGDGVVTFDEFLIWWLRYFQNDHTQAADAMAEFYQSFRRLTSMKCDPPAYTLEGELYG